MRTVLRWPIIAVLLLTGCASDDAADDPLADDSPPAVTLSPESTPEPAVESSPGPTPEPTTESIVLPFEPAEPEIYAVPAGSRPHDVAPAADGDVWYTAPNAGALGHLDPATGDTRHIELGSGSLPHGVIVGPDDAAWVTDGGQNAIVRVDPGSGEVDVSRYRRTVPTRT